MEKNKKLSYEDLLKKDIKNEKMIKALTFRVEKSMSSSQNSFSLFEHNISLSNQVNERTEELKGANEKLEKDQQLIKEKNTKLLNIQNELNNAIEYNKKIIDSLHSALIITDINGTITDTNKFCTETLGSEIVGLDINDFIFFSESLYSLEENRNVEVLFKCPFSLELPCLLSKSVLKDTDDEIKGNIYLLRDISKFKKMEALVEIERMNSLNAAKLASLGEMAGGIAHEINNPLAIISASMKMLKKANEKGVMTEEVLLDIISDVNSTVERVTKIVTGLRTVSRESSSEENEPVVLRDMFTDVLGLCSEKFKNHNLTLEIDLASSVYDSKVLGKRVELSQVFINLFGNAYDAIELLDEKWIKVEITEEKEFKVIRVTDSGCGISEEIQSKMFNPFYTSKEIGKGTGLGLSISKNIVSKCGGSLEVDSSSPNTCFVIRILKCDESVINLEKVS